MLKIVYKEPGKEPVYSEKKDSLKEAQALVDGLIGIIPLGELKGLDLYVNDAGAFRADLLPNLGGIDGAIQGIIRGPVYIGASDAEGDPRSLTKEEQEAALQFLKDKALN